MKEVLLAFCLTAGNALAQEAQVTPLMSHQLATMGPQDGTLIMVEYEPGGSSAEHRHDAYVFVYVLEGALVMQVKGGEEVTIGPGETFFETPEDIHTVSRNASATEPARFLVFFVKEKEPPVTVPAD